MTPAVLNYQHPASSDPRQSNQNDHPNSVEQSLTVSQGCEHSLTTLCSSFQSLLIEDCLQFLSWLFEGTLPHYTPDCKLTTDGLMLDKT